MQQRPDYHTHYGHPKRQATRCGHLMHPTAPYHTPLCPACITSRAKGTMDAALAALVVAGGPMPSADARSQRWQRAKLGYDIAKQRQAEIRSRNQLREEREQTWEETHQRLDSQQDSQAAAAPLGFVGCPACISMTKFPTKFVRIQAAKDVTWWEQPGGLVVEHVFQLNTPERYGRAQHRLQRATTPSKFRDWIREMRKFTAADDARRQTWEARYRTESMIRQKFNIDSGCHFPSEFWDTPISAHRCLHAYQEAKDNERMSARRARGSAPRPNPPRSTLSYSELSEDIDINQDELEQIWKTEQTSELERQARKVGDQVGYLYFVGDDFDGLFEWREDFLRSDRQLIYRKGAADTVMSEPSTTSEEEDDSDEEDDKESDKDMDVDE
ncbi:hypothetical protein DE146DRAFT_625111 [Phaeosphaeria sp. MPI-PUGE-AT-0046c]|nr:hypothetical protein DE146DRAFT_625111 [Phaeosphaeria sp. MPI-PUGE-AT-0046c]